MKVSVNNSLYETGRKEYRGDLKVASKQIQCGIYAVEKDGFCELRKDTFDSKEELKKLLRNMRRKGLRCIGMTNKNCENCKWWADNEVCVNGDSEQVADFTDKDFSCDCHEFKENKND